MKDNKYIPPEFMKESFHCPHCKTLATQKWASDSILLKELFEYQFQFFLTYRGKINDSGQIYIRKFLDAINPSFLKYINRPHFLTKCSGCQNFSIWIDGRMIYPLVSVSPIPSEDMPEDVKKIYEEARKVQPFSPRASAALLRVALEKLTVYLGEENGNLNTRIKNLKSKGLPEKVINSLDIVRIYANEGGSHAGEIDLEGKDNEQIVNKLFGLINFIVEKTITEPAQVDEMFNKISNNKKEGIQNRDN